ncbi:hypothetical protein [Actinoallomurus bryophytorum]|nr:hypothetical protein [Actinoallomurus bryophytorum]
MSPDGRSAVAECVHGIRRAVEVGSLPAGIRAAEPRPRIIDAIASRLR